MQLKGSVAVVTGASAGIGEATAVALAKRGAKVVLTARRKDRLDALSERIERAGGTALSMRCDVTDPDELAGLPALVGEVFGRPCDVLVNNAGIPGGGELVELSYDQIRKVVEVNLLGVMYGTRAFLPEMLKRGHGHIVNIGSLAGRLAVPRAAVYAATKHGVVAFSESLNLTTTDRGVLVTAVNPGLVPTEGFRAGPRLLSLSTERVAEAIVHVIRDGIAPEYSVPRWAAAGQVFRVLTPPLYRWALGAADRMHTSRSGKDG